MKLDSMKRIGIFVATCLLVVGCATARNYQPEMEDLRSKIDNLQSQLQDKNKEVGTLRDEIRTLKKDLEISDKAKRKAEVRLDAALSKLSRKGISVGDDFVK